MEVMGDMERDIYTLRDFKKYFGKPKIETTTGKDARLIWVYSWKIPAEWLDVETDKRFLKFGTFPNYTYINYKHIEVKGTVAAEDTTIRVVPYDYLVTLRLKDGSKVTISHERKLTREKEYLVIKVYTTTPPFLQ